MRGSFENYTLIGRKIAKQFFSRIKMKRFGTLQKKRDY